MNIRFYLDENVPVAVANQLNRRGIEAITARDLNTLGESDANQLNRATAILSALFNKKVQPFGKVELLQTPQNGKRPFE